MSATTPEELLQADLRARINPEKSRKFQRDRLEASRSILFQIARDVWPAAGENATTISIVGSNGKGSTAWYLSALAEADRKRTGPVGLYSSPHLDHVLERIRLDRSPIDAALAWQGMQELRERVPDYAEWSYFEILTMLAVQLFETQRCPVRIFEAGLGGRFDATRMAMADTIVLTRIDLEHTAILGETAHAILKEKLGILGPSARRICFGPQAMLERETILTEIRNLAPGIEIHEWQPESKPADYLQENLSFARFVWQTLGPAGLPATTVAPAPPPGRLHETRIVRPDGNPLVVWFDVAHNPASIERSLRDLSARPDFPGFERCEVRVGVLTDRDPQACLAAVQAAGFVADRMLVGEVLATWPPTTPPHPPENAAPGPPDVRWPGPTWPAADIDWLVVLGSHRIYNYFVELTGGREKTDGGLAGQPQAGIHGP